MAAFGIVTLAGTLAFAGVPEPPHLLYGTIVRTDGIVGSDENVMTVARVDVLSGQVVGEYSMGGRPEIGHLYYLPIRLEALADGRPQSADAALLGQTVTIYVRHGPPGVPEELARFVGGQPAQFVLTEVGAVEQRDLLLDCCCNTSADGNCCALFGDVTSAGGLIRPGSNCDVDLFDIFCELDGYAAGTAWASACPSGDLVGASAASCGGNGIIDIFDVFASLNAFSGVGATCTPPCAEADACGDTTGPGLRPDDTRQSVAATPGDVSLARTASARLELRPRSAMLKPGAVIELDVFGHELPALRGYQVALAVAVAGGQPIAPQAVVIDPDRGPFVLKNERAVRATDVHGGRVTAAMFTGSTTPPQNAYLGTFRFEIPQDAAGRIDITFRESETYFVDAQGRTLDVSAGRISTIVIQREDHPRDAARASEAAP